ncbi:MAG: hypothetical protein ACON4H_02145 [Rubripirellula sp.]
MTEVVGAALCHCARQANSASQPIGPRTKCSRWIHQFLNAIVRFAFVAFLCGLVGEPMPVAASGFIHRILVVAQGTSVVAQGTSEVAQGAPEVAQEYSDPAQDRLPPSRDTQAALNLSRTVTETSDGDVTMRLIISPNEIRVAELLTVSVEIDAPDLARVRFEDPQWDAFGFYLVGEVTERTYPILGGSSLYRWVRTYPLEIYLAGEQMIPPVQVEVQSPDAQKTQRLKTGVGKVSVIGMLGDEPSFSDFRDIRDLPEGQASASGVPWFWWCVFIALVIFAGSVWLRHRKRSVAPEAKAMLRLAVLLTEVPSGGDVRQFTEELAGVLKVFLGELLQIDVSSQSTGEICSTLNDRKAPLLVIDGIRQFLQKADQIRFSGRSFGVDADSGESELRDIDSLVQDTKEMREWIRLLSEWQVARVRGGK